MQFVVIAHDAQDPQALERRLAARQAHIETIDRYKALGHMHLGAALLNDEDVMNGSVIIAEFNSREALDAWLKEEPYVINKVWEDVTVMPCRIGPSFVSHSI